MVRDGHILGTGVTVGHLEVVRCLFDRCILLAGLAVSGRIERHPDPDDRRGRVLRLTAEGEKLVPEVAERLLAHAEDHPASR